MASIGDTVGPYHIVGKLGSGGMGEVYRARDRKLDRDVALKVLPDLFAGDPERRQRFEREAKTLAALNHPNIAAVYGVEDRAIAMELVEGDDLSAIIARGALPMADALKIAAQIADALATAHEQGIVHRDLKPANVKVREDGRVKVLDFGLAKALDGAGRAGGAGGAGRAGGEETLNSPTITAAATRAGLIIGTAAYMAPEQARGKAVDRRADVWAFGVVLYEMLTGRRAFAGEEVSDVLASVLKDTPPLEALPRDTPTSIRRLLRRCLERDRDKRLSSMQAARLEIDDANTAESDLATAPPAVPAIRLGRLLPLAAAAVVIAAVAVGAIVWRPRESSAPAVQRLALTATKAFPIAIEVNHHDVAITRDGRAVIYFSRIGEESQNQNQLVVRRLDQFDATALPASKLGQSPRGLFVSADGQWLGFQTGVPLGSDARLVKVPISGGAPVPIAEIDSNLRGASWGSNDSIVFATAVRGSGLWKVRASGGTPELLTKPSEADREMDHVFPHLLPDGTHALFAILRSDGSDIALLSLDTRAWRVLIKNGSSPRYVPTGHLVYGADGGLRAVAFDASRLEVVGDPIEVQSGVTSKSSGAVDFDVSATGTLVYLPGSAEQSMDQHLVWRDGEGREAPIGVTLGQTAGLELSPDGRSAAAWGPASNNGLWLIDLTRGISTRLPTGDLELRGPIAWSRDSRELVFASFGGKTDAGLFRIAASGTSPPTRLTTANGFHGAGSWTPDGRHLLFFEGLRSGEATIKRLTPGASPAIEPLVIGPSAAADPALSPDGRWLAYSSQEGGVERVFLRPYPNVNAERVPVSVEGGLDPSWSRDGRELFYRTQRGTRLLMVVSVGAGPKPELGKPEVVMSLDDDASATVVSVESRRRILVARRNALTVDQSLEYRVVLNWAEELKSRAR